MAYRVSRERFDKLVEEALRTIPGRYRRYFKNVSILVEDYPGDEDVRLSGVPQDELLGLFAGAAYPEQGGFFNVPAPLPDTITLYQKNIEAICESDEDLIEEIRVTLVHEVGHYFGLSEEDLERYT